MAKKLKVREHNIQKGAEGGHDVYDTYSEHMKRSTSSFLSQKDFLRDVPFAEGEYPFDDLNGKLTDLIVKYRIFQKKDLQLLFKKTEEKNQNLDKVGLKILFSDLIKELDEND